MNIGRKIMEWDEGNIVDGELEYRKENWKDLPLYQDDAECPTEEKIREDIYQDTTLFEWEWEDFKNLLTEKMKKKNPDGYWKANVSNFGWRNLDGHKYLFADTGEKLIREVLPQCDCTFRFFNYGRGLAMQNFHHDSPTGNEWYYIMPITYLTYEKNR